MTNKIESQRLTNSQISAKLQELQADERELTGSLQKTRKDIKKYSYKLDRANKHLAKMATNDGLDALEEKDFGDGDGSWLVLVISVIVIATVVIGVNWFATRNKDDAPVQPVVEQTVQPIQDDWSITDEL